MSPGGYCEVDGVAVDINDDENAFIAFEFEGLLEGDCVDSLTEAGQVKVYGPAWIEGNVEIRYYDDTECANAAL
jgi:hypothetical protein